MTKQLDKIFAKISFLQNKNGYSDRDIANALELSPSGYSRIKNKQRKLTLEHLEKIAALFGVPFFYLFFTEQELKDQYFAKQLNTYIEENDLTYEELADIVKINILRVIELTQGAMLTTEEVQKFKTLLNIECDTMDGRIELIKLLLNELGIDESKKDVILDYIDQSRNSKLS